MTFNNPKISVVVPVYNVEAYLEKCLESIEKQTYKAFEVIIVNDESPDSSLEIAQKFQKKDKRFKVISQKNRGLGGARNTGIRNAKGEFVFLLDSDDYIKENTFEKLIEYSTRHGLDIVVFNYDKVDQHGNTIHSPRFGDGIYLKDEAFKKILSLKTSPQAWNKFYKRDLFINNSIEYPEKYLHEDLPVTYRLFWAACRVGYLNSSYYYWLIRSGSITQKFTYEHINDIVTSLIGTKKYLKENLIYTRFETDYVEGCMKMLNLLFERSIQHSRVNLMDHVRFIIRSESIVSKDQIEKMRSYDRSLYTKFQGNYNKLDHYINIHMMKNSEKISTKAAGLKFELERLYNSKKNKLVKLIFKASYYIIPLGSKTRVAIKKIIGKWQS